MTTIWMFLRRHWWKVVLLTVSTAFTLGAGYNNVKAEIRDNRQAIEAVQNDLVVVKADERQDRVELKADIQRLEQKIDALNAYLREHTKWTLWVK